MIQVEASYLNEALLYERLTQKRVRCNLCAHHCVIPDGRMGVCHVRKNMDGMLHTLVTRYRQRDP
jgi:pyruvate formate lyase activating enzyme